MKNKFLQISIGVSMMFLSAGFFAYSITPAKASAPVAQKASITSDEHAMIVPFGVVDGTAYMMVWNGTVWTCNKQPITEFKPLQ
jgi:hypothetical protein